MEKEIPYLWEMINSGKKYEKIIKYFEEDKILNGIRKKNKVND